MQNPPQISPEGNYWWDGQAWRLMPGLTAAAPAVAIAAAATPAPQPATDTPRPSWLPKEIAVPVRPAPPEQPLIPQPIVAGAIAGPAVYAPVWANEPAAPPEPLSINKKIVCWAGLVFGGGLMLLGILETPFALGQGGVTRTDDFAGAVSFVIFGGLLFLPGLGVLLGFGPTVSGTFHSLGIVGVLYVRGSIGNAAVAVVSPVGGGRYIIPCTLLRVAPFRACVGRAAGPIPIRRTAAYATSRTL